MVLFTGRSAHTSDSALASHKAKEFFTGYLIELSLSIDNLFVFLLIFNYFQSPEKIPAPRFVLGNFYGTRAANGDDFRGRGNG